MEIIICDAFSPLRLDCGIGLEFCPCQDPARSIRYAQGHFGAGLKISSDITSPALAELFSTQLGIPVPVSVNPDPRILEEFEDQIFLVGYIIERGLGRGRDIEWWMICTARIYPTINGVII